MLKCCDSFHFVPVLLDLLMKNKGDELTAVIGNLKECNGSLEEKLKKETSDKLVRL